ncbi:MAG: hypothetical protein OHK0046_18020 [Anaerolineae bacterium]
MSDTLNIYGQLTDRETEVLTLMVEGRTNREIAEHLVIEFETVRWYTKQIYSKMGVHSRAQAILQAQQNVPSASRPEPLLVPHHNLPNYATSFVGRSALLDELTDALHDPAIRLITLAGPGGVGKTRLSVEAAYHLSSAFKDGIHFISLADVRDTGDIMPTIMHQFNLRGGDLKRYLAERQMLLLLDNFEHVVAGAGLVNDLIEQTRHLKILVTSRTSLNLRKEWVRYVDGITTPTEAHSTNLEQYEAVNLFMQRAWQVRPDFSLEDNGACVAQICQLLHGLPLAIELSTTWLKTLSCKEIAREIKHDLDFLSTRQRDVEARHSSLRIVFDHTWQLLTPAEQRIVQKLSVFRGGFGRELAQQVTGASLNDLASLVDKSIIQQDGTGFFSMHELLRQYAEERLIKASTEASVGAKTSVMAAWGALLRGEFRQALDIADGVINARQANKPPEEASALALLGIMAGIEEDYQRGYQLSRAGLDLIHSYHQQDPITLSLCHLGLAVSGCGLSYYDTAATSILAALRHTNQLRVMAFTTLCLPIVSIILAHTVEMEMAVQVLSLAFSHPVSTAIWMQRWPMLRQLQDDLRLELGNAAFDAAWLSGQKLDFNTTVADVLIHLSEQL